MSVAGLEGEVDSRLADDAMLHMPPHLTALYESRHGGERRRRLTVALLIATAGNAAALIFEFLNMRERFALAAVLHGGACCLTLVGAILMRRMRPGWSERLTYGLPVLSLVLMIVLLGQYASIRYADRYMLAAIGVLAALCAVPPVPVAAGATIAVLGLAGLTAALGVMRGTLPLHGNFDLVVFGAGALAIAMLISVRNEAARRRAFLHALRDDLTRGELVRMNAELVRLTNTDPLTGIDNRRKFEADLSGTWSARFDSGLGVLIIDVDHFKQFNDSAGHAAGDDCLRAVARAIAGVVRASELRVARYGGEEFAVLAEGITRAELPLLGERVRAAVETMCTQHPGRAGECVTISIGAAWCQNAAALNSQDDLLRAADTALYAAKMAGRNRVVLAESKQSFFEKKDQKTFLSCAVEAPSLSNI